MDSEQLLSLSRQTEDELQSVYRAIDRTAEENTRRVLDAFREFRVSESCFAGTTGYGYDDHNSA